MRLAFTPGPATDQPGTRYGFGWFIGDYRGAKETWHSGNTLGFTTRISRFPETQLIIILLTNRNEASLDRLPHQIVDQLIDAGIVRWKPSSPKG